MAPPTSIVPSGSSVHVNEIGGCTAPADPFAQWIEVNVPLKGL